MEVELVDALEKTIRFLEANPNRYSFFSTDIPKNEADQACLLGWIGYFGKIEGDYYSDVAEAYNLTFNVAEAVFNLTKEDESWRSTEPTLRWAKEILFLVERKLGLPEEWQFKSLGEITA